MVQKSADMLYNKLEAKSRCPAQHCHRMQLVACPHPQPVLRGLKIHDSLQQQGACDRNPPCPYPHVCMAAAGSTQPGFVPTHYVSGEKRIPHDVEQI